MILSATGTFGRWRRFSPWLFVCATAAVGHAQERGDGWLCLASFGVNAPRETPFPPSVAHPAPPDLSRFRLSEWASENEPGRFRLVPTVLRARPGFTDKELAMAVYGETGGLLPRVIRVGSVYDPATWATLLPGGVNDLHFARRLIAETRKSNKSTHLKSRPPARDKTALRAWVACEMAAVETAESPLVPLADDERLHFFIRQVGKGRQKPAYLKGCDPVMSLGPFVNVGGGDVPKGSATYIDFYVLPLK